jgi:hypothetical protein
MAVFTSTQKPLVKPIKAMFYIHCYVALFFQEDKGFT